MTNGNGELPAGWRWVKLGEVCRTTSGGTPLRGVASYFGGNIPWVKSGELSDGLIVKTEEMITQEGVENSSAKVFPAGTLLIALYGATVGKLGILGTDAATNQAVCAMFPNETIHREFLFFWLLSQRSALIEISFGGAQPNISQDVLRSLSIPLPPLPEQQRIAAVLSEQMAAVTQARAAARAQLEAVRALPAAYLREVFESEEARGWEKVRLGDAGQIASGVTLGRKLRDSNTRRVLYLRVANVKDGRLALEDVNEIEATEGEIAKLRLQYGDLLLTEGGDPDKLGRGMYWEEQLPECIHQNHIFRVRFDLNNFHPAFVSAQVGSSYGKAYFLAHAKQTTGIATINQKVLANFPLGTPSLKVQTRIATSLAEITRQADRAIQAAESQLIALAQLPAALLRRAFSGGV